MKKITLLLTLFLTGMIHLFAQTVEPKDLPLVVQSNFQVKFPDATNVKWTKINDIYDANFINKEVKTEAKYTDKGEWKETYWGIPVEYTPQAIKTYVTTNYPNYKIKETKIEEVYPSQEKLYAVNIGKKKDVKELFFKITGEFVKVVPEKKEEVKKK